MPTYPSNKAVPAAMGFKDPQAILDYAFLWQDWLAADETITAHTITPSAATITVDSSSVNAAAVTLDSVEQKIGSVVTVWLSAGTADTIYVISCRVTTSAGRVDERSFKLIVRDR
ncbi:MAG: hypothetical protein P9E24_01325 [Candidatus Competibacter sp.]|nr:hypothetical protein [Candidatus Competibacter sp.]MDG4583393.1 hypothetical protein [Candidatus Competibacter sp.]